jgi:thymidylate kinase
MIIIIEGIDGSGKSTLAASISRQTKYPVVHMSYPKTEDERAEMIDKYVDLLKNNTNLILDRSWYSEMAYGSTMRGASMVDYPAMYMLERLAAKKGAMLVYCVDKEDTLWKRCQSRGEDYVVSRADFGAIYDAFEEVMNGVPHLIPVVTYGFKDV